MATKSQSKNEPAAGSLNRAVILLTAIARGSSKGSLLTELVARTGLPRPTIHRVLDMLMEFGWVERDPESARFNLGADLAALGYTAIGRHPIERIAATELSALAERLEQVVYLAMRSSLDMVCIGRYDSESQIQVGKGRVGLRGPFGMSPACLAMFSRLPSEEVEAIIEVNLPRYHRIEGFDESGFRRAVEEAMKSGYGTYDNIVLDRTTSALGVPICDAAGYPVAAIGTTYITGWLNEDQRAQCLHELRQTAARIAARLMTRG